MYQTPYARVAKLPSNEGHFSRSLRRRVYACKLKRPHEGCRPQTEPTC
jgi:hypothetical protein